MTIFQDTSHTTNGIFQTASIGPSTDFSENFQAGTDAFLKSDLSISEDRNLKIAYAPIISALREKGESGFANPYDQTPTNMLGVRDQWLTSMTDRIWSLVDQIKKSDPTFLSDGPQNHADLNERTLTATREAAERFADVSQRSTTGGTIGGFLGQVYGALHDPAIQLTMPFGAGLGSTVLRTALIEAGIAGGTEAVIQPFIQDYREKAGLPHGADIALANVLTATLAGGAFGGGIRALRKAFGGKFGELEEILAMPEADLLIKFDTFLRARDAFDPNAPHAKGLVDFMSPDEIVRLADDFDDFLGGRFGSVPEKGARFGETTAAEVDAFFGARGEAGLSKAKIKQQQEFLLERSAFPPPGVSPHLRTTFTEFAARADLEQQNPFGRTPDDVLQHDQNMRFMVDTFNQADDVVGEAPWTPRRDMIPDDELVALDKQSDALFDDIFGEAVPARARPDFVEVVGDDGNIARMKFDDVKTEINTAREFLKVMEACR